jgi:hypothetical protein
MIINPQLTAILNKEMNRQDFLKHIAIGALALTGFGMALRLMSQDQTPPSFSSPDGYDAGAYGGSKEGL